jgi:hypothetical protein
MSTGLENGYQVPMNSLSTLGYSGENLNARKVYVPTVREICFFLIHVYFTYTIIRYIMSQKNSRYSEFSRGKLEFDSRDYLEIISRGPRDNLERLSR